MTFLLDTNICIFAIRGDPTVVERLKRQSPAELAVSNITLAELWFGAKKSRRPEKMRAIQDAFLRVFAVLDFSAGAADQYASIRFELERRGTPIGERDQMIAAVARANALTLVTANVREFSRVPDLSVEDWTLPNKT